jgi:hypothetical protein
MHTYTYACMSTCTLASLAHMTPPPHTHTWGACFYSTHNPMHAHTPPLECNAYPLASHHCTSTFMHGDIHAHTHTCVAYPLAQAHTHFTCLHTYTLGLGGRALGPGRTWRCEGRAGLRVHLLGRTMQARNELTDCFTVTHAALWPVVRFPCSS